MVILSLAPYLPYGSHDVRLGTEALPLIKLETELTQLGPPDRKR